jgi:hypothetical protein
MTVHELTRLRRMTLHRLHLLESGEMRVRCLKTALLDNSVAISAARRQIADIDAALAGYGQGPASRPSLGSGPMKHA